MSNPQSAVPVSATTPHLFRKAVLALTLTLALGAAACASGPQRSVAARGTSTELSSETGRGATVSGADIAPHATTHAVAPDRVWLALLKALPSAGVPVTTADKATWTAGTPGYRVKGRISGDRISTYLRCGSTAGVAEVADAHHVTFGAMATLVPTATGTELQIRVGGSAKDPFTSVPPRQCASTGKFEVKVDSIVRLLLRSE